LEKIINKTANNSIKKVILLDLNYNISNNILKIKNYKFIK